MFSLFENIIRPLRARTETPPVFATNATRPVGDETPRQGRQAGDGKPDALPTEDAMRLSLAAVEGLLTAERPGDEPVWRVLLDIMHARQVEFIDVPPGMSVFDALARTGRLLQEALAAEKTENI